MRTSVQQRQSIDRRDPVVAQFVKECGLATTAVAVRLVGENEADLKLQIERLKKAYGTLVMMTEPRQGKRAGEWIAYGTLLA